ncbi:MAG: DUF2784 domain-containing protein [Thiobacillus sp.]|nr:DUF2784 domain-containing protein [Thiobacillus sp.]
MSVFLADMLVLLHLLFVVFVMGGGFLLVRWPKLVWLHLPAVIWGAYIEFSSGICPLTPLENQLRVRGGDAAYSGDFVEHYLLPLLYPAQLTPGFQIWLGFGVVAVNALAYALAWRAWRRRSAAGRRGVG